MRDKGYISSLYAGPTAALNFTVQGVFHGHWHGTVHSFTSVVYVWYRNAVVDSTGIFRVHKLLPVPTTTRKLEITGK